MPRLRRGFLGSQYSELIVLCLSGSSSVPTGGLALGTSMDEDDEVPSLLLQAWSERLPHLADFCDAALSPSQDRLLLLSREGDVVVLPLGTGSEGLIPDAHLPVLQNVKCLAWAQCEGDSRSEQLLFTAGDGGLRILGWDGCRSQAAGGAQLRSDVQAGQAEELRGEDSSSEYEEQGTRPLAGEGGLRQASSREGKGFHVPSGEGELEDLDEGLRLRFTRSPSGGIASTVSCASHSFSRLITLGLKYQVTEEPSETGFGRLEEDIGSEEYRILEILSSPGHRVVALVFGKQVAEKRHASRVFAGNDPFVVLAAVEPDGLKLSSCERRPEWRTMYSASPWVDFTLSRDILAGLTQKGQVFLWAAGSGKFLFSIDVTKRSLPPQVQGGSGSPTGSSRNHEAKELVWSGFSKRHLWMEGAEGMSRTRAGQNGRLRDLDLSTERYESNVVHHFTRLALTADSRLLAAGDVLGIVFVVSLDEDLSVAIPGERLAVSDIPCDAHTTAMWCVAGIDIGRYTATKCHQWLHHPENGKNAAIDAGSLQKESSKRREYLYDISAREVINKITGVSEGLKRRRREVVVCSYRSIQDFKEMVLTPFEVVVALSSAERMEIVCNELDISNGVMDDINLAKPSAPAMLHCRGKKKICNSTVLPFSFCGSLYFVTPIGLHVVLPPLALGSGESILRRPHVTGQWWPTGAKFEDLDHNTCLEQEESPGALQKWQAEVLDRALIYDGLIESEKLCVQNGWSLSLLRLRRLELGLSFIQINEIEKALETLMRNSVSKPGVLRTLFAAIELMINGLQGDKELARSSNLLAMAASFGTRLIQQQGWLGLHQHNRKQNPVETALPEDQLVSSELSELAGFLELIRGLQDRLNSRVTDSDQGHSKGAVVATDEVPVSKATTVVGGERKLEILSHLPTGGISSDGIGLRVSALPSAVQQPGGHASTSGMLEIDSAMGQRGDESSLLPDGIGEDLRIVAVENSGDMVSRWERDKLDAAGVVKDALQSGRVPLALVQLQALYAKENAQPETEDLFQELQEIGRGIVYQWMCEGKTEAAIAALSALGEDVEVALQELALGTTRRDLRNIASAELQKHGWLGADERELLEKVHHLEGVYPVSSFWSAYNTRRKHLASSGKVVELNDGDRPQLTVDGQVIECGEVDGAVIGSWNVSGNAQDSSGASVIQDNPFAGYFSAAAIWLFPWDKVTFDRVLLDQPGIIGYSTSWETKLDYHIARHNWSEVSSLLDEIPSAALHLGQLYVSSNLNFESVEVVIPEVQILSIGSDSLLTIWMRQMMEDKLLRNGIFMQTRWKGTTELVALLARGDRLFSHCGQTGASDGTSSASSFARPVKEVDLHESTVKAVQQLMVLHCVENSLPHTLSLHVDQAALNSDKEFASRMLAIVDGCHWASWLLLSYMEGCEYDASVENAKFMVASGSTDFKCSRVEDVEHTFHSFDHLCEAAGEKLAYVNLVYTPVPLKTYMWSGLSTNSFSLSPSLSRKRVTEFPTLWKRLVACSTDSPVADLSLDAGERATNLAEYLSWRKGLFSCARNDLSILEMMPQWTPKNVRRLVQLSTEPDVEGLLKLEGSVDSLQELEEGPEKWEALIQASIEKELYMRHPEESEPRVLFFLRRGRGAAAFEYLLDSRLKSDDYQKLDPSAVLSALMTSEQKVVSLAVVLAVREYANARVVTACICFLELCGVPASMVRIVVLSLRRISEFLENAYKTEQLSKEFLEAGFGSAVSQMRTLVENYVSEVMNTDDLQLLVGKTGTHRYRQASIAISELLEKAILHDYNLSKVNNPQQAEEERTVGYGRSFSEQWATVTAFCHAHQIPLSYAYLRALARGNDWVDFLAEAQIQGCPLERLIPIVATDFSDTRLRSHILIVLKSLPSTLPKAADFFISEETGSQEELFTLIAACEKTEKPSLALLQKARDLKWPLLPVVASCYDDVDPLLCFDVWLGVIAPVQESGLPNVPVSCEAHAGEKDVCLSDWMKRATKRQKTMSASATPETQESTQRGGDIGQKIQCSAAVDELPMNELLVDHGSLAKKVALFCEQQQFFPLLRGFELFLPSSPLLPFIRFLQAFSQMRLTEASAHLSSFSTRLKEELQKSRPSSSWITGAAISAADAMLDACPSPYERHRLLQLLSAVDFGDGGPAAIRFRRLYWKMQLAEPALQDRNQSLAGGTSLEDDELLMALAKEGRWEDARSWARQLDLKDGQSSMGAALHHVTETQAEAMVTDWKELLWDFPEQRAALWGHCHALFTKYSFPPQRAGLFFLKHANDLDSQIPSYELHQLVLFAYQWLSDPQASFPPDFLGELETRVWMLAVEAESEKSAGGVREMNEMLPSNGSQHMPDHFEKSQDVISKANLQARRPPFASSGNPPEIKSSPEVHSKGKQRRIPGHNMGRRAHLDDKVLNVSDESRSSEAKVTERDTSGQYLLSGIQLDEAFGGWKAQVDATNAQKAMLDLLEAGHLSAAKQLQQSLSIGQSPVELGLVEAAWNVALADKPVIANFLSTNVVEHLYSGGLVEDVALLSKPNTLEALTAACRQGCGQGFCRRIGAVSHIANVLGLPFSEAFEMESSQLLQLLALRGQDALAEAELLVTTHSMEAPSIAQILAESFLKGLVAAHRGGYLNGSQKEEGPAPLLWRRSDFTMWAKLCPSEPEVGHALMRLVSSEQAIPLACEVELLILTHHFYAASDCLDGMVILVALASERVKIYVAEGAFICLARLLTGIADFRRWRFILDLLIEHGQLNLLLRTYSEAGLESPPDTQGFCLALLSALKHFNPHDIDALEQVYSHFSMKHDLANLKQARARKGLEVWVAQNDLERSEDLLEVMRLFVEAGQLYAAVEAGNQAKKCCAQASLISLQLLMPEHLWLNLSDTNARRLMVEQPRFQEALIVAEAYGLNQPAEWVPVIWNHMLLYPARFDHFLSDFVATLPLTKDTLLELTRFYRAELAARGDQIDFSKWLTPAGVQLKTSLAKGFRLLLNRVPDIRLRIQLAIMATGFPDVVDTCSRLLDKVPENAGPLLLKRGHGGAYLPIM